MIRTLGLPECARVRDGTYLPPVRTDSSAWRSLLVGKYGLPARDSDSIPGEGGLFRLGACVGSRGGQIVIPQPNGAAAKGQGAPRAGGMVHMTDRHCRAGCGHAPFHPAE